MEPRVQRERELTLIANQLHEIGYRGMNSHSLKPKACGSAGQALAGDRCRHRHDQEPHGGLSLVGQESESPECGGEIE